MHPYFRPLILLRTLWPKERPLFLKAIFTNQGSKQPNSIINCTAFNINLKIFLSSTIYGHHFYQTAHDTIREVNFTLCTTFTTLIDVAAYFTVKVVRQEEYIASFLESMRKDLNNTGNRCEAHEVVSYMKQKRALVFQKIRTTLMNALDMMTMTMVCCFPSYGFILIILSVSIYRKRVPQPSKCFLTS
jgi:hypothetical protein